MSLRPTIFTISAFRDSDANVWVGTCEAVPVAAEAPSLDQLALLGERVADVLPEKHPDLGPASVFLQLSALREIEPHSVAA